MNLEDVAREAGVSRSTVSRVINNDPSVSRRTREHVLGVVRELNYTPNHAARTLATSRSNTMGVVIPGTSKVFFGENSYFPMLLQGIAEGCEKHQQSMVLYLQMLDESSAQFAQRIGRSRIYDGLIISSITNDDRLMEHLLRMDVPFIMVERPLAHEDVISYVTVDNVRSGQMATEHLISLGYTRIAHITGNMKISDARDRLTGYRRALERAGLPYDPALVVEGTFTYEGGLNAMKKLLPQKPRAIFLSSDAAAIGALSVIQEAGLSVPDDIALIGFDDIDVAARANPALTTIRQPIQQKGSAGLDLLYRMVTGQVQEPRQVILPTQLVIRQSCGAMN